MNYDAEIRVKTDLDNGKFEVSARKVKESLDEIGRKADGACAKLDSMEKAGELKDSRKYRNVVKELERWIDALDELIKKREMALDNMELDWDVSKGSIRDDAGYQKVLQEWSEAEGKARELQARTGKYFSDSAETVRNETGKQKAAVTDFSDHLNLLRTDVEEYASALKELEEQGKYFGDADYDRLYLAWKNAVDEVKKYQAELNKQTDAGQAKEAEKAARAAEKQEAIQQRLEAQAERNLQKENAWIQAEAEKQAKLQAEEAEQQRLAEIKANATVADQRMIDLLERKRQLTAEIAELEKAGVTAGYAEYDSRKKELDGIRGSLAGSSDMSATIAQFGALAGKVSAVVGVVTAAVAAVKKLVSVVKNIAVKIYDFLKGVAEKLASAMKLIYTQAKNLFSKLTAGFRESGNSISNFRKRLLELAKSAFIFNVISGTFRSMISGVQDSLKEFTRRSAAFNADISSLLNALATLKNAIAGAFAPIISIAIPYLVQLINYITMAVNAVSQLIAALTGAGTWNKAIKQNKDYAASLNGVAGSAEKAQGALARFDDLDVWQKPESATGRVGAGDLAGDMFEEVPISDKWKDMADWFKKMWELGDFYELGKWLGDKLAEMLANIPWDKIKANARKLAHSLATFINGFIKGEFDGKSVGWWIGHSLAEALNTAFEFLNEFVHTLDWASVGKFIADMVNGFFTDIDWPLIYDTFITGARGLAAAINSFADNLDWNIISDTIAWIVKTFVNTIYTSFSEIDLSEIAIKIGEQINRAFKMINFYEIGATIGLVMISLLNAIRLAIDTVDWNVIGQKLVTVFNNIYWPGVMNAFFDACRAAINAAIDLIYEFVTGIEWKELGEAFGKSISNEFSKINWTEAGKTVGEAFKGFFDFITEAIKNIDWIMVHDSLVEMFEAIDWEGIKSSLGDLLKEAVKAALQLAFGDKWEAAQDAGEGIVDGIKLGIMTGMDPLTTIAMALFRGLIDAIKNFLGIHSPSTVFQEIGGYLVEGLLLGIQEVWTILTEWFATTFEELTLFFEEKWMAIKEGAMEIWTTLKDTLLETWENIRESASEKFVAVKKVFEDVWTRIKQVLDEKAKNIKEKIDELLTKFTNFKSEAATAFENVKNSVVNALNPVIEKLKVFVQWVKDAIAAVQDFFNSGYEKVGTSAGKTSKGGGISVASFSMNRAAVRAAAADLPHLASGSVIRGGNPFLAVLGDQRSGQTNVEAPLSTIRQAVREELAGLSFGGGNVQADMTLDGETFARLLVPYILDEMNRQGLDVNVLGVT